MGIEIAEKSKETRVKQASMLEISIWTQINTYTEAYSVPVLIPRRHGPICS